MTLRRIAFLLAGACLLGLLLLSCEKQSNVGTMSSQMVSPTWPPDTMKVTILGSSRLRFTAFWKLHGEGGNAVPSNVYTVSSVYTPAATSEAMVEIHTPPDTTVKMILDMLAQAESLSTTEELLLIKWPPDTTTP